jgi:DNA polymerase-3 subunit delta'
MAKRARSEDIEEIDRVDGFPHPRETFRLVGQDAALATAARAIRGGRTPQAWLITGPPGIGKATLAYRIARYLLRYGASAGGPEDLSVPPEDSVSRQMAANAHPGLLVLKRGLNPETGKMMKVLSVNVVRELAPFFGMTSGGGGWRVAIIDTADDMNDAAANALLKALEEPPANAMLMLLSNAPGRLLPTIRSRCQRLDLRPLSDARLAAELARLAPDLKESDRAALVKLSAGSLGAALALVSEDGLSLARDAERAIEHASHPDYAALFALGDRLARSTDSVAKLGVFLSDMLAARVAARARAAGGGDLRRWTEAWEKVRANFEAAAVLNLEPRQTIVSSVRQLSLAARRSAL